VNLLRGILLLVCPAQVPKTGMVRAQHRESLPRVIARLYYCGITVSNTLEGQ